MSPAYRIEWYAPSYEPGSAVVDLKFFTSNNGFTVREAADVCDLDVGMEICFDNWDVRVLRLT